MHRRSVIALCKRHLVSLQYALVSVFGKCCPPMIWCFLPHSGTGPWQWEHLFLCEVLPQWLQQNWNQHPNSGFCSCWPRIFWNRKVWKTYVVRERMVTRTQVSHTSQSVCTTLHCNLKMRKKSNRLPLRFSSGHSLSSKSKGLFKFRFQNQKVLINSLRNYSQ